MEASTADALGLSRAILVNGMYTVTFPVCFGMWCYLWLTPMDFIGDIGSPSALLHTVRFRFTISSLGIGGVDQSMVFIVLLHDYKLRPRFGLHSFIFAPMRRLCTLGNCF